MPALANETANDETRGNVSLRWMYALLLDMGGCAEFVKAGLNDTDIARELGVLWLAEATGALNQGRNSDEFDAFNGNTHRQGKPTAPNLGEEVFHELRCQRARFLEKYPKPKLPEPLGSNVRRLGELVGLDELEQQILAFSALVATDATLNQCCEFVGRVGFNKMLRILANLLDQPLELIRTRLARSGTLIQAGLIEPMTSYGYKRELEDLLKPTRMELAFQLCHYSGDPIGLFASAFRTAPAGKMTEENYRHLGGYFGMAEDYLRTALATERSGVNVLLYGAPGTGKSELTRLLANRLGAELFEISCTDYDGDPINGFQRLCSLRSAMCVLAKRRVLLVMDEIEDLFSETESQPVRGGDGTRHKAWTNRMLEENPLPCFWLTNNIHALDNAYIRRFDLLLKLENPPRHQRLKMVEEASSGRIDDRVAARIAEHEQLTPAVITRAIAVADQISTQAADISASVESLVDATLVAQGFETLSSTAREALPPFYSPESVNADYPLQPLVDGLRQHSRARLCFYGPPGTGKTAFGLWIAKQLGRPLSSHRASDLISPFLGLTERNFAAAFKTAERDGAVLLLDEVDTFLQDRQKAQHSWEISAVNEMLTQMESYRGLFIASTNLMNELDPASMRRFDLKIKFGYLKAGQISILLDHCLKAMGLECPCAPIRARLLRQTTVTPGDFAAVSRRARFAPFKTASDVVDALVAEASLKDAALPRPMGFVH